MKKVYISKISDYHNIEDNVHEALDWIGWRRIIKPNATVFIKPNLTWPAHLPGVTTSPDIIEALVSNLKTVTPNITIGESNGGYHSFVAEEAFKNHKIYEIAKKYNVGVVNLSDEKSEIATATVNSKKVSVELPSLLLREIDVFITVPVPKVHAMTKISLAFKNQWGCIPNTMRLKNHPDFNEKIVAINKLLNPQIVIYDGIYFLDINGPMSGNPIRMDLIIGSNDIGVGDLVCSKIMKINSKTIEYFNLAEKEGMFPSSNEKIKINDNINKFNHRKFRLKRTPINLIALAAFKNHFLTTLFYNSSFGNFIHKILFIIRRNPLICKFLYGGYDPPK